MIWKIYGREGTQRQLSNSFNAAKAQQNQNQTSRSIPNRDQKPIRGGKQKNGGRKPTTSGSHSEVYIKNPYTTERKRNPGQNSKIWNPAEIGDSRIPDIGGIGSRYYATLIDGLSDRTDWTRQYSDRS